MGWPETATQSCAGAAALVRRTDGRPPGYDRENDYDVVFRGRKVGRIWKYDYTGKTSGEMARWLWHWDWRNVEGRKDADGHCGSLAQAMADFRRVGRTGRQRAQHHRLNIAGMSDRTILIMRIGLGIALPIAFLIFLVLTHG